MKVRDVLDAKPMTAAPDEWAASAWERMQLEGADHLVVLRDHQIVGVLSRHDLGGPAGGTRRRMGRRVADLMRRDVVTTTPGASLRTASRLMRQHQVGCLPVVHHERLVGLVTVWRLLSQLEQQSVAT